MDHRFGELSYRLLSLTAGVEAAGLLLSFPPLPGTVGPVLALIMLNLVNALGLLLIVWLTYKSRVSVTSYTFPLLMVFSFYVVRIFVMAHIFNKYDMTNADFPAPIVHISVSFAMFLLTLYISKDSHNKDGAWETS